MKKNNVNALDPFLCCGCEACVQRCPTHCITMMESKDGFLYPKIDESKCLHCNLCVKTCPSLSSEKSNQPLKALALYNLNEEERMRSSSGGVFIAFAKKFINEGGIVCGVVFDDDWMPHHICAEKIEEVLPMMGSKYVQSRTDDVYCECETYLKKGRKVLFTGTPCQTAALHTFLMHKNYPNLLTVDVICHGVPSPGVWRRYLKETLGKEHTTSSIKEIRFRDKTEGWERFHFVIRKKGSFQTDQDTILLSEDLNVNPYIKGFVSDLYLRESCYRCPARPNKSFSDLTIGDFWGWKKLGYSFLNDHKGLSIMVVNTKKGNDALQAIKSNFCYRDLSIEEAIMSNSNIITHERVKKTKRINMFLQYQKRMSIADAVNKATSISFAAKKIMGVKHRWNGLINFYKTILSRT